MMNKMLTAQVLLTIVIASQGIFYILGAAQAYYKLPFSAFSIQRTLLDEVIATRLKVIYIVTLAIGIISTVSLYKTSFSIGFVSSLIATLLIAADMMLAVKVSIPINRALMTTVVEGVNASNLQAEWLRAITMRGILSIAALLSILAAWASTMRTY